MILHVAGQHSATVLSLPSESELSDTHSIVPPSFQVYPCLPPLQNLFYSEHILIGDFLGMPFRSQQSAD
jgi:hypothetical protein